MKAVVQCGGKGTRLRPYTSVLPKPLMPIGARPVLEMLLKWLRRNSIEDIYITTGYLGHLIRSFCGDGRQWGMRLQYTEESEPLGTLGALSLLRDKLDETFLVVNGDILTDLNLTTFVSDHRKNEPVLTIAATHRIHKMDYGVIAESNGSVTSFKEKPDLVNLVSMGVYCMEPNILQFIPCGMPYGFDDLMLHVLDRGVSARTYLHSGAWLDIGRAEDFNKAQEIDWDEPTVRLTTQAA